MAVTTKDLRTATRLQAGTAPFVAGQDRDVTFYANLNNTTGGPRKIRIYVDSSSELIARRGPRTSARSSPELHLHRDIVACATSAATSPTPPTQPIFEYYDINGTQLPTPLSAREPARGLLGEGHARRPQADDAAGAAP